MNNETPQQRYYNRNRTSVMERVKEWAVNNPNKYAITQLRHKLKQHGVTHEQYLEQGDKQNWLCAICKSPDETMNAKSGMKVRRLSVDHCHKTNTFRGLLCGNCNRGVGLFSDDPARLREAADYLDKHTTN